MPVRPDGRSLADFGALSEAEQKLLDDCRNGKVCEIGRELPAAKSSENTISAAFLRLLILGGDDATPIRKRGLGIKGAWIADELDLQGATSTGHFSANFCMFDVAPNLEDAHIRGDVNLSESKVPGLKGGRLVCDGSFIADGLVCDDSSFVDGHDGLGLELWDSSIGGDLLVRGAKLKCAPAVVSLSARLMNVGGNVNLINTTSGIVSLPSATIGGRLECMGATLTGQANSDGVALEASNIVVKGNVLLNAGTDKGKDVRFKANGDVNLTGATISGNLDCRGAVFNAYSKWTLNAERLSVSGFFFFGSFEEPVGQVNLQFAHVRILEDDENAWGERLNLHQFTYDVLSKRFDSDAAIRLAWLDKQLPELSGKNGDGKQFRPQPWRQLRNVFIEAGYAADAREVAIRFENRRRHCGQITGVAWVLHWIYGTFTNYGYRPQQLLLWSMIIWLVCGAVYDGAAYCNVFVPTDSAVYEKTPDPCPEAAPGKTTPPKTVPPKPVPNQNWVFNPPFCGHYPAFHPFAFSANVFLPVVQLGQEAAWGPGEKSFSPVLLRGFFNFFTNLASFVQLLIWVETLLGWIAGLLLVAVVSGLARKQDDS